MMRAVSKYTEGAMRKTWVLGNWKLNQLTDDVVSWVDGFDSGVLISDNVVAGIAPSFPYLSRLRNLLPQSLKVGAQTVSEYNNGAYTGEVSSSMLRDLGVEFALVGHSERRQMFGDTNKIVLNKVNVLLEQSVLPVVCVGETEAEFKAGKTKQVIAEQLANLLSIDNVCNKIIVAYEPIWAIGTGLTATPDQAQEIHSFIRAQFEAVEAAESLIILYGGSVNEANAKSLFLQEDIDGALVGGASLSVDKFSKIIRAAS